MRDSSFFFFSETKRLNQKNYNFDRRHGKPKRRLCIIRTVGTSRCRKFPLESIFPLLTCWPTECNKSFQQIGLGASFYLTFQKPDLCRIEVDPVQWFHGPGAVTGLVVAIFSVAGIAGALNNLTPILLYPVRIYWRPWDQQPASFRLFVTMNQHVLTLILVVCSRNTHTACSYPEGRNLDRRRWSFAVVCCVHHFHETMQRRW